MGTCQPPIQNFGAPNGLFCVGNWQCYPDCHDWYWMGQRRTVNGGWVGNPFSGYTLVPKPTAPCGFPGGGQSLPPPPPQSPPAPPPAAAAPPVEIPPPKPPHDTAPPDTFKECGSGSAMATTSEMERDFGFSSDEQAGWPGVGKFVGVNKYAGLQTVQGDTIQKQTRPTVSVPAYIEKDADGNIRVLHPATGPGEIWLAPPEIEDYQLAGEHASHTGKLAGVALPKTISRVGLNIASFKRANSSHGDDVDGYLGWGVYHPAGAYVADGWIAKLTGAVGARHLEFFSTDVEGALDGSALKNVKINGTALGAGLTGNEVTAASAFAAANRILISAGADRTSDDTTLDFSGNVISFGAASTAGIRAGLGQQLTLGTTGEATSLPGNVTVGGTLASGAHTVDIASTNAVARSLGENTTTGPWRDEYPVEFLVSSSSATLDIATATDTGYLVELDLIFLRNTAGAPRAGGITQKALFENAGGTVNDNGDLEGPTTLDPYAWGVTAVLSASGTNIRLTVTDSSGETMRVRGMVFVTKCGNGA